MKELTPKKIVRELDKYIVGQAKAKKAVAIAMRNRWRRQQVNGSMRDEIMPNNIIMIGGDGTFHEIVTGIMTREDQKKIHIGIIPGALVILFYINCLFLEDHQKYLI